jgi:hypothetical protein
MHDLGLSLLFQGRSTLSYARHSPITPPPLSREHVVFRRLFIQSRPSPLPSLLSTTTHTFAPICDFSGSKMTYPPTFYFAITQFAVKNWPGMSGFTPLRLFTRIAVCAILSCLATFSKPTNQTQLSAFMSWRIYLIADTPKTVFLNLYVNILNRPN